MFKLLLACLLFITASKAEFSNPVSRFSPDPWMVYHNGFYYLISTTFSTYFGIRKASNLAGLKTAQNQNVFQHNFQNGWAPEIHLVNGKWYMYYTACIGSTGIDCHRVHVAESAGDDPMGPYTYKGELTHPQDADKMQIDPTLLRVNGKLYLVGSNPHNGMSQLYIRELSNPYTAANPLKYFYTPSMPWEHGGSEGPEPLYHNNKVFLSYSACYCGDSSYKLGLLELVGSDPMNPSHWKASPNPVFQTSDAHHIYGPGHNGFFKSPDNSEDWLVYHAFNVANGTACGMDRSARAKKIIWGNDGSPVFGEPDFDGMNLPSPSGEH